MSITVSLSLPTGEREFKSTMSATPSAVRSCRSPQGSVSLNLLTSKLFCGHCGSLPTGEREFKSTIKAYIRYLRGRSPQGSVSLNLVCQNPCPFCHGRSPQGSVSLNFIACTEEHATASLPTGEREFKSIQRYRLLSRHLRRSPQGSVSLNQQWAA